MPSQNRTRTIKRLCYLLTKDGKGISCVRLAYYADKERVRQLFRIANTISGKCGFQYLPRDFLTDKGRLFYSKFMIDGYSFFLVPLGEKKYIKKIFFGELSNKV